MLRPQKLSAFKVIGTVKPVYSGHLRFSERVSAITKCQLYRVSR